jgi:hypothetical protein
MASLNMRQFVRRKLQPEPQYGAGSTTVHPNPWSGAAQGPRGIKHESPAAEIEVLPRSDQEVDVSDADTPEVEQHGEYWTTLATRAPTETSLERDACAQDVTLIEQEPATVNPSRIRTKLEMSQIGSRQSSTRSRAGPRPRYSPTTVNASPVSLSPPTLSPPADDPRNRVSDTTAVDLLPETFALRHPEVLPHTGSPVLSSPVRRLPNPTSPQREHGRISEEGMTSPTSPSSRVRPLPRLPGFRG